MNDEDITLKGSPAEFREPVLASCLPETKLTVPDELREPAGGEEGVTPLRPAVSGIPVWSRATTVACDYPTVGDPVSIPDGRCTETVYLRQVPSIPAETLAYIATHNLEEQIAEAWHNGTLTARDLKKMSAMRITHARQLLTLLQQVQERVDGLAFDLATSTLECYWCSEPQIATCDDPEMAKEGEYAGVMAVFSYTVDECAVKSYVSQEDANDRALQLAESMLNCFYVSDPCTATCETRPDRPLEAMEHVPNDIEPLYPGLDLRVGTYVVEEGAFISYESKEDANSQACALAYSMLNCWYPNLPVEAECERDENGEIPSRNLGVDPLEEPPREADIVARTAGQMVHIPPGFFTSLYSTEAATQEAEEFAASLLECCFINDEQAISCEAQQIVTAAGEVVMIEPDPEYGPREVVVPRGMYTSCVSQEEANKFAIDSMEGQLNCMYCNVSVPPTCVPDWVHAGVENGTIKLPLDYVIEDGTYVTTADALPPESTRGIGGRAVCNPDAQVAQLTAEAMARVPMLKASDCARTHCTYSNWLFIVACAAKDPFYPALTSEPNTLYERVSPDGEPYYFYTKFRHNAPIAQTRSKPVPGTYITLEAGVITSQNDETQEEVNERAFSFIMSMLDCQWENPTSTAECGCPTPGEQCAPESINSLSDEAWALYFNTEFTKSQLTPWSTTGFYGATVSRGTITDRSDDEATAFHNIKEKVIEMLSSMVVCTYFNREVKAGCNEYGVEYIYPSGIGNGSSNNTCDIGAVSIPIPLIRSKLHAQRDMVTIPAKTFVGMTPIEADEYAIQAAQGLAKCDYDTISELDFVEPTPTPTPGGGGGGIIPPGPNVSPTPTPTPSPTPSPTPIPIPSGCCWYWCPGLAWVGNTPNGNICGPPGTMTNISLSAKIQQEYTVVTLQQQIEAARARINQIKAQRSL